MSAQITHLPANTTQEELLHSMAVDGAVIIDDVLGSEQLEALDNDLAPFLKKEVYGRDAFTGFHTQRIGALIARSKACGELALDPACWMPHEPIWRRTATIYNCTSPPP